MKKKSKCPQSVVDHYSKYKNTNESIKQFLVQGTKFEMDKKYEVIDSSKETTFFLTILYEVNLIDE